jgi:hypothetical protein
MCVYTCTYEHLYVLMHASYILLYTSFYVCIMLIIHTRILQMLNGVTGYCVAVCTTVCTGMWCMYVSNACTLYIHTCIHYVLYTYRSHSNVNVYRELITTFYDQTSRFIHTVYIPVLIMDKGMTVRVYLLFFGSCNISDKIHTYTH